MSAGENRMMLVDLLLFGFDMLLNEQEVTQQAEEGQSSYKRDKKSEQQILKRKIWSKRFRKAR